MSDLTEALDELRALSLVDSVANRLLSRPPTQVVVAAARRWDAFPSDEDVEAAAEAMFLPLDRLRLDLDGRTPNYEERMVIARAALEAVKADERKET